MPSETLESPYRNLTSRQEWLAQSASRDNRPRQYGKTTGEILVALGRAIIEPGIDVEIWDSTVNRSIPGIRYLLRRVVETLDKFGFQDIVLTENDRRISVRSENYGVVRK